MATRTGGSDRSGESDALPRALRDKETWIEPVARAGYTAKGVVYAVIGVLAVLAAFGSGGQTSGSRGALREIASAPYGKVLVGLMGLGLVAYVLWRIVQAVRDPGQSGDEGTAKRVGRRAFYLASAVLYGFLAYYAVQLAWGSPSAGGGGGGGGGGGSGQGAQMLAGSTWGLIVLGAIGVGLIVRGGMQLIKAYTESFRKKISSFQLGPARSKWVLMASRLGITARGVIFFIIGGFFVYAAWTNDPSEARGLEGVLEMLQGQPWLLGAIGVGIVGYAVYQWVKARYRLIGVG